MNKDDINEWLNNGMQIGSHTQNHVDLTKLDGLELKKEIENSKKFLEETFATPVKDFCYPFGKVNSNAYLEVKKIYNNAYTTNRSRYLLDKHDPFLIPRVDMGKKLNNFKIFLKLKTFYEDIKFLKNEI
jgi:peptidoglycan/xylan/chitin deacetylase (PgdA/CDA1 family)